MTELITAPPLRALTDDQLAEAWQAADVDDPAVFAEFTAEMARRDAAERTTKARAALGGIRAEGETAAFTQYLEADKWCRGRLLSRDGMGAVTDEIALWHMPEDQALRYASEELRDFWLYVAPRITPGGYVRQRAAAARREREERQHEQETTTTTGETDGQHDHDGQGLGGDEPRALRREPASPPPPRRPGGTVPCGGRGPGGDGEGEEPAGGGTGRPGGPVRPGHPVSGEPARPASVTILDEIEAFANRHVYLPTPHNARVMACMAAVSYATPVFPATFRGLFAGKANSGKTTAMKMTVAMSANPVDLTGTEPAARSAIFAAANTPELGYPTFYMDDMKLFGDSGMGSSRDLRADVLRRGYKRGETLGVSRAGVDRRFNIYAPFLMSGLEAVVQGDVRTRCIILWHEEGEAEQYFDIRFAEPLARDYGRALKEAVRNVLGDLEGFRGYGYHPKLRGRALEIWEPLLAVALHVGGQRWLNYMVEAFIALTGAGSNVRQLTPRQQVISDAVTVMGGPLSWAAGHGFIPGDLLGAEFARLPGKSYEGMNENALLQHIAANMTSIRKRQVGGLLRKGYPLDRMMGYLAQDIRDEWDMIRPDEPEDVEAPEAVSPFAAAGEDDGDLDDLLQEVQGVQEGCRVQQHLDT